MVIKMHDDGKTLQEIGKAFDISRQRVWQILKKECFVIKNYHKKTYIKIHNTPSEIYIIGKLTLLGFNVKSQPYNHYFDLLVNNKKIEIKYRKSAKFNGSAYYYSFQDLKPVKPIDLFIFMCGKIGVEKFFIVPSDKVNNTFNIAVFPKKYSQKIIHNRYLENWDLLNTIAIDK